jgi:hypothetical protein
MLNVYLATLALTATALVASGCGGTSKTTTTATALTTATATTTAGSTPGTATTVRIASGKPLIRSQWLAYGDAICARAKAKTSALTVSSIPDFARVYPQIAIYNRIEAGELSKLVPPTSAAHDWTQIVGNLEQHAQYVREVARYIQAKQENSAGTPFHLANVAIEQMLATAKRDGFKKCSIAR